MQNKKNVHLIPHTHWDREWYYSSVNSKAMCYWSMKYMISFLEKNKNAKFLYDGQTSIVDDFLAYAPEWKERLKKVIKSKQLMVGPWYTQTDNLQPMGESILRNLEIGGKIAKDMGHRMNVGYLPDSFGHNPQTPQIMRHVGIDNFTFYRGIDPKKIDNKLYFNYKAPSGDEVLGIWQTHYFTSSKWNTYEGFMKTGYKDTNTTGEVTVESYDKRSLNAPFWITMGGDMRNFKPEINNYVEKLNDKSNKYNFLMSDYESLVVDIKDFIKKNKIELPIYEGELRDSFTGRAHRSIMSSRMDLKQKIYKLESSLINVIEPLSVVCSKKGIDVPWKMIERTWKDLFKTSAHDSYGGCVEDFVYEKMMQRLDDALLLTKSIEVMLMKIMTKNEKTSKLKDQIFIMNTSSKKYTGPYNIQMSYEPEEEGENFKDYTFYLNDKEVNYYIKKRNEKENYNRVLEDVVLFVEDLNPFEIQEIKIKYDKPKIKTSNLSKIKNNTWKISIKENKINIKNNDKEYLDVFKIVADASAGDTYDHSPINFKKESIIFKQIRNVSAIEHGDLKYLNFNMIAKLPNSIESWRELKKEKIQDVNVKILIFKQTIHFTIDVINKCDNLRLRALINLGKEVKTWEHDMQYYMTERIVESDEKIKWKEKDENNDQWLEYPTNLSPHQNIIKSKDAKIALITKGSKEHEIINFKGNSHIALTLYRALDVFSRGDMEYRPGRPSGRPSIALKGQLKNKELSYEMHFITDNLSDENLFNKKQLINEKISYVKNAWDTKNPLEVFGFEEEFYISNINKKYIKPNVPKGFYMTALYKNPDNELILRMLNVSNETIEFEGKKIKPWKLLIKKV